MKPLSELLQEQIRTDVPPLRHSVDDVVAVGRRRVRRRNSGWALAAVVAVTTAIGVPQLVGRSPEPSPPPPAATTPAPAPVRGDRIPPVLRFRAYETKSYTVQAPTSFGLGYVSTNVFPRKPKGLDSFFQGATLQVFEPGVDPGTRIKLNEITADEPINGRQARRFTVAGPSAGLLWEYADGASAILVSGVNGPAVDGLWEIAEGLRIGREQPVVLAFKVGHLPDGYRLASIVQDQKFSTATFLPTEVVRAQLTGPPAGIIGEDQTEGSVNLSMSRVSGSDCSALRCRVLPGGRYQLDVSGDLSEAEAQKVLDAVVAHTPDDQSTWIPVEQAVPEQYQLRIG